MTPELSDAVKEGAEILPTIGSREALPMPAGGPGDTDEHGDEVIPGPHPAAAVEVPTFLRAWRGYDRHQVDTFARQSLALIHALRRRAQRAESRLMALEKQLAAYRHHGQDVLADPSARVEMAISERRQGADEGSFG